MRRNSKFCEAELVTHGRMTSEQANFVQAFFSQIVCAAVGGSNMVKVGGLTRPPASEPLQRVETIRKA